MASLSTDPNGNRTIQFVGGDGKRRTLRLGRVSKKVAESVKVRVETLASLVVTKLPMDCDTAAWVAGIGDKLADKLSAVGLIPCRKVSTMSEFFSEYIEGRRDEARDDRNHPPGC